jgi:hypothetical protein
MRKQSQANPTEQVWRVHVIYGDGSFEDRYVVAGSAEEANELVEADTPPVRRRWARFVV